MFSAEFGKWLGQMAQKHGVGVVFAGAFLYMGHTYVQWIGTNMVIPVVNDHREFLKTTTKAMQDSAEAQKQTASAVSEIRASLADMRRGNDVGKR